MTPPQAGKLRLFSKKYRGQQIKVQKNGVRPTPGIMREALFNILRPDLAGACFLDLYGGSGAVGFEAHGNGCNSVYIVENNSQAFRLLKHNAEKLNINQDEAVHLIFGPAALFLKQARRQSLSFDLIFVDPPYKAWDNSDISSTLLQLKQVCSADAQIIFQRQKQQKQVVDLGKMFQYQQTRSYGSNCLDFFRSPKN